MTTSGQNNSKGKKNNPLFEVVFNIIVPSIILMKFSGPEYLAKRNALGLSRRALESSRSAMGETPPPLDGAKWVFRSCPKPTGLVSPCSDSSAGMAGALAGVGIPADSPGRCVVVRERFG